MMNQRLLYMERNNQKTSGAVSKKVNINVMYKMCYNLTRKKLSDIFWDETPALNLNTSIETKFAKLILLLINYMYIIYFYVKTVKIMEIWPL